MKLQESLTKENFWNALYQEYPKGTQVFCDWIDEYKKEVEWDLLIGYDVKFHNLPHAMQLGIWVFFLQDMGFWMVDDELPENLRENITNTVKLIEQG